MVVDVTRGFTAEELREPAWDAFKADRLKLGRAWKEHNGNRGDDLGSMMPYKYHGPPNASR